MLERYVLHSLSSGVDGGGDEGLDRAIGELDPLFRPSVRRRAQALLVEASCLAPDLGATSALRLAYLLGAGAGAPEPLTDEAVSRAYLEARAHARPAPSRRWWALASAAASVLLVASLLVARQVSRRRFDPRRTALGASLSAGLPTYVVSLDRARGGPEAQAARALVLTSKAREQLGPAASSKLEATFEAAEKLSAEPETRGGERTDRFLAASADLEAALRQTGVPFFVDADVLSMSSPPRSQPFLLSFYVEREAEVKAGDQPVRALHLWRLDQLNLQQGFLGYARPRTPAALVLLDQIEAELVRYVLPAMPEGEPAALVDDELAAADVPWRKHLEQAAARVVREHYAAPGADGEAASRVGKMLARRRSLIAKWRREIAGLGMLLRVPERLVPEADYRKELDRLVPRAELIEWDDIHDDLLEPELEKAFVRMRKTYAAQVERHEVQHRWDFGRGLVPVPEPLRRRLGLATGLEATPQSLAGRSRDETSAYLAAIASSPASSRLELMLLARFLFAPSAQGDAYCYAALTSLEEIARELGLPDDGPLVARGSIAHERAATRLEAALAKSGDEVSAAAKKAWERLYDAQLPAITAVKTVERESWRHLPRGGNAPGVLPPEIGEGAGRKPPPVTAGKR